jgi:hypothetical protein
LYVVWYVGELDHLWGLTKDIREGNFGQMVLWYAGKFVLKQFLEVSNIGGCSRAF